MNPRPPRRKERLRPIGLAESMSTNLQRSVRIAANGRSRDRGLRSLEQSNSCSVRSQLDPEVVEPYLKENLAWRILKVDRSSCDIAEVPSLQVILIATPLAFEDGAVFPHAGAGRHCHEITEGQPVGHHAH